MGAKPRLIYDNLWRKGTALASSPIANPQHPVSDTQIDTLSMFFRASAITSPCTIPMNLLSEKEVNFVAILGHNIDSDATITLEGDAVSTFDSGAFVSRTLAYNATNIFQFFTAFTKKYVQIKLVSGNGDFSAMPQIATILCGSYSEFNRRPVKGHTPGRDDITEVEETDARVIFAQEKTILNVDRYMFAGLDNTTKDMILAFLKECGIHKAFVWCTDYIVANANSFWVRNSELISPVFQSPNFWNWEITMKEIV